MIRVETLSKQYKGVDVLNRINWRVEDGAFVIVTGRSGGGKTTLLSIVGGLTRPGEGKVFIDDADIWQLPEPELATLRNRKLGFVFQFPSLIPTLHVLDNVLLPIAFSGRNPNVEDREFAGSLLEMVGVTGKDDYSPSQLSGGQQRRVAIARAMINRPSIMLADEPTGDLDEKTEEEIMRLFQRINGQGTTVIMVTHALGYVKSGLAYTLKNSRLMPYEESEVASGSCAGEGEL
ncbi:MAG: ABC transporter ATP-binding protein [Deltaproteobacteria bacterium]|jgi:ABC-type lipoprotein export system ATPase subunit|nr:ABC transporter ATP-binding protein [Deltaproteobacteria bacterium]